MSTTTTTTDVAVIDLAFSDAERYALAAFLAGYRGLTREAYGLDLRQFVAWCAELHVRLFGARPADIECFARDLEAAGRARATLARRLCTVAGSTATPNRRDCLSGRRRPMFAGLDWTTSRMHATYIVARAPGVMCEQNAPERAMMRVTSR